MRLSARANFGSRNNMTVVMEDSMQGFFRTASLAAALLAGTAGAHAQYIIETAPGYIETAPGYAAPPAVAIAPAPAYIAPPAYVAPTPAYVAPSYVAPAPRVVVAPPPMAEEIVTRPAPRTIVATDRQEIVQPQASVRETVVERSAPAGSIHRSARTTRVHLTSRQRRDVLRTIRYERTATPMTRERFVTRTETPTVSYSVGSRLPAALPTYAMPREVVYEAPALQGYAYAPVGNRVLVVEPATNMVVDELE
jgi:hypothetical protein